MDTIPAETVMMLYQLCLDCATHVYAKTPPPARYAENTARLMLGTAAAETKFADRRQTGYMLTDIKGAFGIWQSEMGAMVDNIKLLSKNDPLRKNAMHWLSNGVCPEKMWHVIKNLPIPVMALCVCCNDRLAALMCRLHYMRFAPPIPDNEKERAIYYKEIYNTKLGVATEKDYLDAYYEYIMPVIESKK